jgi:undecaprenyl diphosphate synthase
MTDRSEKISGKIPQHIAVIMDGNGRWAKARGLPRLAGHNAGTESLRKIIKGCVEFGVKYLTIYAFSTENWGRPQEEVEGLMHLLAEVVETETNELHAQGVQIRHIGELDQLKPDLRDKIEQAIEKTKDNDRLVLVVAFNYGGRNEIANAVKKMIATGVAPEDVSETLINDYLYTKGIPDPDMIIRTSGEMRVSNFLIWQGAYAEWYVTPTLWPDFDKAELKQAIDAYSLRDRRFGKLSE